MHGGDGGDVVVTGGALVARVHLVVVVEVATLGLGISGPQPIWARRRLRWPGSEKTNAVPSENSFQFEPTAWNTANTEPEPELEPVNVAPA